jgi:hypothetical protein
LEIAFIFLTCGARSGPAAHQNEQQFSAYTCYSSNDFHITAHALFSSSNGNDACAGLPEWFRGAASSAEVLEPDIFDAWLVWDIIDIPEMIFTCIRERFDVRSPSTTPLRQDLIRAISDH